MELQTYLVFLFGAFILVASPGADFIYVLSRSITQGSKSGFWAVLGVTAGVLTHTIFAAIGLTALLYSSAIAFTIVKYIGAAYLIYLGIKTYLNKFQFKNIAQANHASHTEIFRQSLLTNILNPKVGLTFMAYMPQFISPTNTDPTLIFQLGFSICIIAFIWLYIVSLFSSVFRKYVVESESVGNALRYFLSSVLIGFGLKLAWLERR